MARKPGKWPHHALWALEDVQAALLEIQRITRDAQEANKGGRNLEAVILMGDVREKVTAAIGRLIQARNGDYQQEIELCQAQYEKD